MEIRRVRWNALNIVAHHMTFKKWWKEVQRDHFTANAAKYCEVRKAFGCYVIEAPEDMAHAIECIYQFSS